MNKSPNRFSAKEKERIYHFLSENIPYGTVVMPETVYDSATNWAVLYDEQKNVIGFSAQKSFDLHYFSIIQIMGTFLIKSVRGKKFATLLMQGRLFVIHFLRWPFKPVYWCSRTRMPGALAAAMKHSGVVPYIFSPEKNKPHIDIAEFIAKKVYGQHIYFDADTFKISNSYMPDSQFVNYQLEARHQEKKVVRFFQEHVDYAKNEAIFFMSKLSLSALFRYSMLSFCGYFSLLRKE